MDPYQSRPIEINYLAVFVGKNTSKRMNDESEKHVMYGQYGDRKRCYEIILFDWTRRKMTRRLCYACFRLFPLNQSHFPAHLDDV